MGELHFHLHTGINAIPQHFLLPCSVLGFTVCAFFSGFTSAKPPVLDPPLGCEDTQTLTALMFFPMVQSTASLRGEDSFGHRCSLWSKASLQCAGFVAAVKAKAQSFVIFER